MPVPPNRKPVLEVRDLSFRYDDKPVLDRVNFTLYSGDFAALVGPNGAGKTSLMNLILGFLKPLEGSVRLAGEAPSSRSLFRRIAYVPQSVPNLNLHFPASLEEVVRGNLYTAGRAWTRAERRRRRELVDASLARVRLAGRSRDHLDSLSGGELRKVLLARALISDPDLLFLDEPTAGVDQQASEEIYELLSILNERDGLTVLLITHELYRIKDLCGRFLCLGRNSFFELTKEEYGTDDGFRRLYGREA